MSKSLRVLVTAFGAFPGAPVNPTGALAALLARRHAARLSRLGLRLTSVELPVVYAGAEARVLDLVAAHRPDVVLHLGLAARRKTLTFEARARNRLSRLHPDATRAVSQRGVLEPGGPAALPARAPVSRAVAAMRQAGVACAPSMDAGDYLCNQTLWAALRSPAPIAGFLHIPRPRRGAPLTRTADAVAAAVLVLARAARERQRTA